jgi:O-antigen/teichoic acid export membrane protein
MTKRKELIKATLIFSVLSMLQPLSNFLLLPVYTKYLSVQQYGYFSILNNVAVFFSMLSALNIATSIVAFYKSYKNDDSLKKFIGNVITFSIYFNAVLLLLFSLWGNGFSKLIFKEDIPFYPNVFYVTAYGLISSTYLAHFNYLKYQRKLKVFALLIVLQFVVLMGLQYFFIVTLQQNITGALLARLIAVSIVFCVVLYINRQYIFKKIDYRNDIIPQLKYSIITGPAVLIGWLSAYVDRFIIEHRTNDADMLGQYSFLATICAIAEIGIYAFNSAVQPYLFDSYVNKEANTIKNYYKMFIGATILCISGLILAGCNLQFLIKNESMRSILNMVPLMAGGYIFFGVASVYSLQITFVRKSTYYLITYGGALLANIVLNLLLIDKLGMLGIIIASVLTKFLLGSMMVFFAQRSFKTTALRPVLFLVTAFVLNVLFFWLLSYNGFISLQLSVIGQFVISCVIILVAVNPKILKQYIFKNSQAGTVAEEKRQPE